MASDDMTQISSINHRQNRTQMIEVVWRGIKLLDEASPFESLWDGEKLKGEGAFFEDVESRDETTTTSSCSSSWSDDRSTRSPLHLQEQSDSPVGSDMSCALLRNSFSQRLSRSSTIPLYDNEVKETILDRASSFYTRYGKPVRQNELYHEGSNTAKRKIRKANPMKRRLSDAPQLEQYFADRDIPTVNTIFVGSRLRISISGRSLKVTIVAGLIIFSLVGLLLAFANSRRQGSGDFNDDFSALMDGVIQMSDQERANQHSVQRQPIQSHNENTSRISSVGPLSPKKNENKNELGSGASHKTVVDLGFPGSSIDESFSAVWEPLERPRDVPLFLQIPRSGGKILNNILRKCHNFVTTSGANGMHYNNAEWSLNIVPHPDGGRQVNVNTFTSLGLQRSRELGLVNRGVADVIFTNLFQDSADLFDRDHRGRIFTLLRNPVHQAASVYYHLRNATRDDPAYDRAVRVMTLEEYATSPKIRSNPLTRLLTNDDKGKITDHHIDLAKEILKQKVLIGIEERFDESIIRFQNYFGWHSQDQKSCMDEQKMKAVLQRKPHPVMEGESAAYRLLAKRNWADMELYRFAVRLFEEQDILIKQVHR